MIKIIFFWAAPTVRAILSLFRPGGPHALPSRPPRRRQKEHRRKRPQTLQPTTSHFFPHFRHAIPSGSFPVVNVSSPPASSNPPPPPCHLRSPPQTPVPHPAASKFPPC